MTPGTLLPTLACCNAGSLESVLLKVYSVAGSIEILVPVATLDKKPTTAHRIQMTATHVECPAPPTTCCGTSTALGRTATNKRVQWFKMSPFLDHYHCNTWCCLGDSNLSAAAAGSSRKHRAVMNVRSVYSVPSR